MFFKKYVPRFPSSTPKVNPLINEHFFEIALNALAIHLKTLKILDNLSIDKNKKIFLKLLKRKNYMIYEENVSFGISEIRYVHKHIDFCNIKVVGRSTPMILDISTRVYMNEIELMNWIEKTI